MENQTKESINKLREENFILSSSLSALEEIKKLQDDIIVKLIHDKKLLSVEDLAEIKGILGRKWEDIEKEYKENGL